MTKPKMNAAEFRALIQGAEAQGIAVISRAAIPPDYRWELQEQAPAGNWAVSLSTNDLETAVDHAKYLKEQCGKTVRIVDNRID